MKQIPISVAAAILVGLAAAELRFPQITDGNRRHTGRALENSPEAARRIAAAEAKRTRRTGRS